ncbi:MAG TPA: hypothetical protein VEL74_23380 [Thermoanaerobaculia bacterium]|nr:hypothetical protein [Thermoanaerobaculia bacterium]
MTTNRSLSLVLLILPLLIVAALRLSAQPPAAPPVDLLPQAHTVVDLRHVGTAMWAWLADQRSQNPRKVATESQGKAAPATAPISEVPVISHQELTKILVPRYIASVPEKDGWGHRYEYRMNVANPQAEHPIALRSPGQDGRFSTDTYEIGGYFHDEVAQDLAWMDGYFVRWPEPKKPAK